MSWNCPYCGSPILIGGKRCCNGAEKAREKAKKELYEKEDLRTRLEAIEERLARLETSLKERAK